MSILESVKTFLKQPAEKGYSSNPEQEKILVNGDDTYPNTGVFFDDNRFLNQTDMSNVINRQKEKIMKYRNLALIPEVNDALDEIINEIIFSFDDTEPLKLVINEENEKLEKAINKSFEKINQLFNTKRNLFQIVRRTYIDGIAIVHAAYDKSTKQGIKALKLIEPVGLYYDKKENIYKYIEEKHFGLSYQRATKQEEYNIEEVIREDFGLYDGKINLSYLEFALKPANMLKTLEDLLIPLRFSRSISRRVFNVDIGDLPSKRGQEVMKEHQDKFTYKKFFNAETGEIKNHQHITSMVEDYWFANRNGGKGTQVDVLDESGNLGELGDIEYFNKKLYKALKIPSSRLELENEFDFDTTRTTKDDMKFFMFISRVRKVYSSLFKEILKREVISTGIMNEKEWEDKETLIEVQFTGENSFIEKMKLDNFMRKLDIYATAQEYQGKLLPVREILKTIFKYNDKEIEDNFKEIQKEEKDKLFAKFYQDEETSKSW